MPRVLRFRRRLWLSPQTNYWIDSAENHSTTYCAEHETAPSTEPDVDQSIIGAHLAAARTAPNNDAKGKAYEALVAYLFSCVPTCIVECGITNVFGTEQIDVAVGNLGPPNGLYLFPRVFLIECKDWNHPVDSKTVGYFLNILASRSVEVGILYAANGITGDLSEFTYAHALGLAASSRGIKLVVVTTDDITGLGSVEDFVNLLHQRLLRAYATGTVGAP